MSSSSGVTWFHSFYQYDPSSQGFTCIYFTKKKGTRCSLEVNHAERAAKIRREILESPREIQETDLIERYICCICCNDSGNARHRDRIEDDNILPQLAERWRNEILQRHELTSSTTLTRLISPPPEPEFRPRLREPGRRDTVSHKMLESLWKRDKEMGSLYIFERSSSPGYVKIGWTAHSVHGRLADWAKCGYKPRLLFRVDDVPHAQRVETLTHFELIKEWRKERPCKAAKCRGVRHQEWFEISGEKAEEVLRLWAKFMKRADPYGSDLLLKPEWQQYVKQAVDDGKLLSAQDLWGHHNELSAGKGTQKVVANDADPTTDLKEEEQEESCVYEVEEKGGTMAGECEVNKEESKEEEEDDRLVIVEEKPEPEAKKRVETDRREGQ